jgi:alpha-ketoglutaric semialdehyde dehydrogenase
MNITGQMLIGNLAYKGMHGEFFGTNPVTNEALLPAFGGATVDDVIHACDLAEQAFQIFSSSSAETRAQFLELIATKLTKSLETIVERAHLETGLPLARLNGEMGRTTGQLKLFANELRSGRPHGIRIDPALMERQPMPRSDLRMRHIGIGPVAVFGASNFPLAFSVVGGDTASALAAGCPVVVKCHSAHPGTSELVGKIIQQAVQESNLPEGVFSLVFGSDNSVGQALVSNSRIKAVGFTGSRAGGFALMRLALNRQEPIPFYGEMSSINPFYIMPEVLKKRPKVLATGLVNSMLMGAGQFCTNPGLIIALDNDDLTVFVENLKVGIEVAAPNTMLTPGIANTYLAGVTKLSCLKGVSLVAKGLATNGPNQCQAHLFATDYEHFISQPHYAEEIFGSCSLLVRCKTMDQIINLTKDLEGQLTATIQVEESDEMVSVSQLVQILEHKVGRILFNGFPTGVEVCDAMVHGGPFPATSDSKTTSVGTKAIWRFLRPVCYQDFPSNFQPEVIRI